MLERISLCRIIIILKNRGGGGMPTTTQIKNEKKLYKLHILILITKNSIGR